MPDINDENLGLASMEVRREAAIEQSLAKVRHHLGNDWTILTVDDITALGWLLGEMWATMGFMNWQRIDLSSISLSVTDKLIDLANQMRSGKLNVSDGIRETERILGRL